MKPEGAKTFHYFRGRAACRFDPGSEDAVDDWVVRYPALAAVAETYSERSWAEILDGMELGRRTINPFILSCERGGLLESCG